MHLTDTPGATLPLDYLGFSGVEASLSALSWRPSPTAPFAPRPSYVALMRLLGGSGLRHRFGHFYAPNSSTHAFSPSAIEVNATTCARLSGALGAIDGRLTAMIAPEDLADGSFVAATGRALRDCLGPALLLSLELANEPDISSFRGNYSGYVAALELWVSALEAAGVRGVVDAPVLAGATWWPDAPAFLARLAPRLRAFVQHRYGLTACRGAVNTPEALMRVDTGWGAANDSLLLGRVAAAGLPFVVGEGNSVSCNGSAGVSDVFAAALYAIDASLSAAAAGIAAYTWHGLGDAGSGYFYQPVYYDVAGLALPGWDVAQPRPLYLGLWLLAAAGAPGGTLLALSANATGSELLRAWALRPAQGSSSGGGGTRLVLLHKDAAAGAAAVTVVPAGGGGCAAGQVAQAALLLGGPGGLAARGGCSFGNQTFDGTSDGVPVGERALLQVPCRGGVYSLQLQAGSGAVLYLP